MGGGGGGQVLTCYSDDPSSNTAGFYSCFRKRLCLKIIKINKKRPGLDHH